MTSRVELMRDYPPGHREREDVAESRGRANGKMPPSLTALLAKYAQRTRRTKGKTQAQIARDAWLDNSYVSRLLSGQRANPSRDALILLACWGLELSVDEVDELLIAAEFRPLVLPASIR